MVKDTFLVRPLPPEELIQYFHPIEQIVSQEGNFSRSIQPKIDAGRVENYPSRIT